MHLCFDGIVFSLQTVGGISVYFEQIIGGLVRGGQRVTLWGFPGCEKSHSWPFFRQLAATHPNFSLLMARGRIAERLRRFNEDLPPDVVFHSTYYRLPARRLRARVVTTLHDFTYERRFSALRRALVSRQKFQSLREADAVVCISSRTAADIPAYVPDLPREKVHVVSNGASLSYRPLPPSAGDDATLQRLGLRPPYALFVGRRVGHKNFEASAAATATQTDLQFVVAGGGELSPAHRSMLESQQAGRWIAHGFLSEEDLNFLYNRALALLYPSSDEGFGIPVVEAARAGCPAITLQGGLPQEVNADPALSVADARIETLVGKLNELRDPARRQAASNYALNASRNGTWEGTVRGMLAIYAALAATSR